MKLSASQGPSVVGVGIDLADVGRLTAAIGRRRGLAARLFTASELETMNLAEREPVGDRPGADDAHEPAEDSERGRVQWESVAQRFAAKEAVMKALGVGIDSVSFTDIELSDDLGSVLLRGRARRRGSAIGAARWSVEVGVLPGPGGPVATAEAIASRSVG